MYTFLLVLTVSTYRRLTVHLVLTGDKIFFNKYNLWQIFAVYTEISMIVKWFVCCNLGLQFYPELGSELFSPNSVQ